MYSAYERFVVYSRICIFEQSDSTCSKKYDDSYDNCAFVFMFDFRVSHIGLYGNISICCIVVYNIGQYSSTYRAVFR